METQYLPDTEMSSNIKPKNYDTLLEKKWWEDTDMNEKAKAALAEMNGGEKQTFLNSTHPQGDKDWWLKEDYQEHSKEFSGKVTKSRIYWLCERNMKGEIPNEPNWQAFRATEKSSFDREALKLLSENEGLIPVRILRSGVEKQTQWRIWKVNLPKDF